MQCVRGVAENTALASPLLLQDPGGGSNFVYSFGEPFITAGPSNFVYSFGWPFIDPGGGVNIDYPT